ncbi:MAG TPA: iron-containing redox enzyme family protein [Actinomycetota bacterium]|nr:iron-containing redox enzyme family protein [Actinomycetota bacterium]
MNPTLAPEAPEEDVEPDPARAKSISLPPPRGPISRRLLKALRGRPGPIPTGFKRPADPLADDDLHLALYVCYEMHYRGFPDVDPRWEWEPGLIAFRNKLEQVFEAALLDKYMDEESDLEVVETVKMLANRTQGPSLSSYMSTDATYEQFLEFVIHRSAYQLKEADPHTWAIPRLDGKAKAAMVEIQADEYGGGRYERMHAELFRNTMLALGLNGTYGAYLERIPGVTLATVNLISFFGLHRRLRGATVGHLAIFEMTSSQPNKGYGDGARRLGATPDITEFYDEHVEADSVHEVIAAYDLAGGLAAQEPEQGPMILFGARACAGLDARFSAHVLDCWSAGQTSLRQP